MVRWGHRSSYERHNRSSGIELFNRGGIDALITRPKPGRPRKAKLERVRDLLAPVLADPAQCINHSK